MKTTQEDKNLDLSLVNSWSVSLMKDDLESIISDLSEVALDAVLDDGLFREIPFVSTVVSIYKIGHTVKERHYIKKLAEFLTELQKGNVDEKTRQEYIQRITKNKRKTQREIEYLLILIDRLISERKVRYLAKLYLAHMRNEVDWPLFCKLSEVVDHLLPGDEEGLEKSILKNVNRSEMDNCAMLRLQGLGIVAPITIPGTYDIKGNVLATRNDGTYALTPFGDVLAKIIKN